MKDNKVRTVRLRVGKSYLELSHGITGPTQEHVINTEAEQFQARENASQIAQAWINLLGNDNTELSFNE